MAFNPKVYNETNNLQENDAISLIDLFVKHNNGKFHDIIVDIGCGTGNVTKLLSQKISHNRIFAFDIDSAMTEFAKNNNSSKTIEYLTEDISKPWDQWIPELKSMESKVSLIFSNFVLHWIEDKETAVKNINKLLKVDGSIGLQIFGINNVIPLLRPQLQQQFIEIPTIEQQLNIWKDLFINEGIDISYSEQQYMNNIYVGLKTLLAYIPVLPKFYKIYVKSKVSEDRERVVSDPELIEMSNKSWFKDLNQNVIHYAYEKSVVTDQILLSGSYFHYIKFVYIGKK